MNRLIAPMQRGIKFISLVILLLNVFVADAQILIKADDPLIRYDLIQPSHNFEKVTGYDSSGAVIRE